jgi:hypothetical protein
MGNSVNDMFGGVFQIAALVVSLAVLAVLINGGSKTAGIISSAAGGFSEILTSASGGGSNGMSFGSVGGVGVG